MARLILIMRAIEEDRKKRLIDDRKQLREYSIPMDSPEAEFQANYRLNKNTFEKLCTDLRPRLQTGNYRSKISFKLRVLAALNFLANGSYQKAVGNNFALGMSQSAISNAIHEVIEVFNHPSILAKFIQYPQNRREREAIMRGFMGKFGVPGTVGCVDGTHVAIIRPKENEELFFNRKHYHSRNVQIICDSDLNILHVDATFGGASHDSFIFNQCAAKSHMEQLHQNGETAWFLGDLGYAQKPYMMTPIPNAAEGSPEENYNKIHVRARNTVERCIGVLKARWRCLLSHRVLHYDHHTAAKIINACCVLHNICNKNRMPEPQIDPQVDDNAVPQDFVVDAQNVDFVRDSLVQRLWAANR